MNRLLQHFVDSGGSQAPAARPPIPAPPQSSGGSHHALNRGSYQRAAPNGPFYYQPPPQELQWQQRNGSGLEEIPLTSQSSGGLYETVDLNADSSQQHRPPQYQPPPAGHGPAPNSQGFYQQKAPGSTGSAAELFAGALPPARELFGGPPSSNGSGGNPYRRSNPVNNSFASGGARFGNGTTPPKQGPFAHNTPRKGPFAAPTQNGGQDPQHDPFAARKALGGETGSAGVSAHDPFAVQRPKNADVQQQQPQRQQHNEQNLQPTSSESADRFCSTSSQVEAPTDPFASAPSQSGASVDPFASTPSHLGSSPFDSPAPSTGQHQSMASADSLFSSAEPTNNSSWAQPTHPEPTNNGNWPQPAQPTQPEPSPAQAQDLFASEAPTASSLFGGDAPSQFQASPPAPSKSQINALPSPVKPPFSDPPSQFQASPPAPSKSQINALPSPVKPPFSDPPSPMTPQVGIPPSPAKSSGPSPGKPPIGAPPSPMINASSPPMRPQVTAPASPVMRPEDDLAPAFGSMKLSTPAKSPLRSPLKSSLDVRHMKFPAGRREDDAVSNAPSMAPSRMSMLSTLDDSLKLSDMYKQMTGRLEGEKHDLLKVVASQAQEIAQMKKQIQSLELQLKKCRPKNA